MYKYTIAKTELLDISTKQQLINKQTKIVQIPQIKDGTDMVEFQRNGLFTKNENGMS